MPQSGRRVGSIGCEGPTSTRGGHSAMSHTHALLLLPCRRSVSHLCARDVGRGGGRNLFARSHEALSVGAASTVFGAAESSSEVVEATVLRSHLAPLQLSARLSLARLAQSLMDGGWILTGTIRRGDEEAPVRLGLQGADVLSQASRESLTQETVEPVSGVLDGWVWSASELTLISDDRGTVRVSVPMPLQERVAELNVERETRVTTRLNVVQRLASGSRDNITTSYSLAHIEPESGPKFRA